MRLRVFYCSRCGISHPFERIGDMYVSRSACGKSFLARPLGIQTPLGLQVFSGFGVDRRLAQLRSSQLEFGFDAGL